jgi:hypothetical protein
VDDLRFLVDHGPPPPEKRADLGPAGDFARLVEIKDDAWWDSLAVSPETERELRQLCMDVPLGGLVCAFAGDDRQRKRDAVAVIANQLRLDVWLVDVRVLVERHGAAGEKLLEPIFRVASKPNAILWFEDFDALLALGDGAGELTLASARDRRPPTLLESERAAVRRIALT